MSNKKTQLAAVFLGAIVTMAITVGVILAVTRDNTNVTV